MVGRLALVAIAVLAAVSLVLLWRWSGSEERLAPSAAPSEPESAELLEPPASPEPPREADPGQRSAVSTEPTPLTESDAAGTVVVTGTVVDEARFPVAGATVELALPVSGTFTDRSDEAGHFRLERVSPQPPRSWAGILRARDAEGRVGVKGMFTRLLGREDGEECDAGTIVLSKSHSVLVNVLRRGVPVSGARVVAKYPARVVSTLAEATTDALGRVRLEGLPAGWLAFVATASGWSGEVDEVLPDPEGRELTIEMEEQRTVEVQVVDAEAKQGIEGAEVSLMRTRLGPGHTNPAVSGTSMMGEYMTTEPVELDIPRTDGDGRTRSEGVPARGRYELSATAEGFRSGDSIRTRGVRLAEGETRATIELLRDDLRTIRWPVVAGEVPPRAEGAVIGLRKSYERLFGDPTERLPPTGTIEGGSLVAEGVPRSNFEGVATAPDGSIARLWISEESDDGREIGFNRPRRIEVRVFDAAEAPVSAASVCAFDQGNNEVTEPVSTDAEGLAVLENLFLELVEVRVVAPGESGRGQLAGTLDLKDGDGSLEVTLDPVFEILLRVRLDGRPGLPALFTVRTSSGVVRVTHEDPRLGELSVEMRADPEAELYVFLQAEGYLMGYAAVPAGTTGDRRIVDVDLQRARALRATLDRPDDRRIEVQPERWDESAGDWRQGGHFTLKMNWPNGPHGSFVFPGLEPGHYRVHELRSDVTSEPVDLDGAVYEASVHLDLSSVLRVSGRIEAPEGTDLRSCRVLIEGEGLGAANQGRWMPGGEPPSGVYVRGEGEFSVTVPGDRPVTLRPWHPWLSPAAEGGVAVIDGESADVVLRLVEGNEVQVPVPERAGGSFRGERSLRVFQYESDPIGKPLGVFHAPIVDDVGRFGGLPPGTWTLWIDPETDYAPVTLRDVRVEPGVTTLAEPEFGPGSTLRVRVLVPEGQDVPRIYAGARKLDEPVIHRLLNSEGETVVLLPGLDAGRYAVTLSTIMELGQHPSQELEVDGVTDVELELDLR